MKTLQLGYGKSGNYWLWNIVRELRRYAGHCMTSYVTTQPVHAFAKSLELSFPEQADIDFLFVEDTGLYLSILPVVRMRIPDESTYFAKTSHVWSHSPYSKNMTRVCGACDRRVYIIRDPRDIALSFASFGKTIFHENFYGIDKRSLPQAAEENLKFITHRWMGHVVPFLRRRHELGLHVLFYEHLRADFRLTCAELAKHLDIDITPIALASIEDRVSFSTMRIRSPGHVSTGQIGAWRTVAPNIESGMDPTLSQLLALLKYRTGSSDVGRPCLPATDDSLLKQIEDAMCASTMVNVLASQ